ncbi:sensor histidine kinase [Nonomuraea sp. NN258]|uniref:sensor histidine kinase n=1 Tax=Nonomuraea antri TaxID=2730852 RepID=UPI001569F76E|nr:histidine kinase [Nonomuraea antri]NRQ31406.1 sensor histidine kinase [Nonomuraea antri]
MRLARPFLVTWRFFQRPRVQDTTMVVLVSLPAIFGLYFGLVRNDRELALATGQFLICMVPLLVYRTRPVAVTAFVVTVDAISMLIDITNFIGVPGTLALYGLGRFTRGRTAAITLGFVAATYAISFELETPGVSGWLAGLIFSAIPVGVGQFLRLRHELNRRRRREAADSAVRAERRRIARELHDVVAHHISVINALVGGARATLPPEQEVTRDALESAEQTARQALAEMRQLLDVLRADGDGADAATGVGANRLPSLIQEARTAGLPAVLTVTGEPVTLPAAVDHAVYRIVQEALTNTRKHALSAKASVRLAYGMTEVEVEVLDDGVPKQPLAPGFGLGGMAERVALCGGQLSTGPRQGGGFRVHARLPLEKV